MTAAWGGSRWEAAASREDGSREHSRNHQALLPRDRIGLGSLVAGQFVRGERHRLHRALAVLPGPRGQSERPGRAAARRLSRGAIDLAIEDLGRSQAVSAAIAAAGLRLSHLGPAAAEKAMQSASALERDRLQRRLAYLGTLGNNAPFVGLFGTVIGVILAFEELGHGAPGHASAAAGQVASQAVMTAIAEALVATAVGIAVALPAVAAYNYYQRRVATLLSSSEVLSNLVLAYLSGTPADSARTASGGGAEEGADADMRTSPAAGHRAPEGL